jgi:hypothetical protein
MAPSVGAGLGGREGARGCWMNAFAASCTALISLQATGPQFLRLHLLLTVGLSRGNSTYVPFLLLDLDSSPTLSFFLGGIFGLASLWKAGSDWACLRRGLPVPCYLTSKVFKATLEMLAQSLSIYLSILLLIIICGTGRWTQGLTFAR